MSQNAIKYLQENKDKYSREELILLLKKNGYKEADIAESIKIVYGGEKKNQATSQSTKFWDFKTKRVYVNKKEKLLDFFFGLISPWILGIILSLVLFGFGNLMMIVIYIGSSIYFFNRRRHIFYGLVANIIIVAVLIVICLFFFLKFSGSNFF